VTSGEPEVVSRERTWPPRPVAQPSLAIARPLGTKRGPNGLQRGTAGKTGIRNMTAPDFFDFLLDLQYIRVSIAHVTEFYRVMTKSRPKYTITSGLTTTTLSRIFLIKVYFTAFRTISGIFESTSGFQHLLPVHRFRFLASVFLIGSISSRLSAIRQPYGPEYGKKGRPRAIEVKPEVEIWRQPVFLT